MHCGRDRLDHNTGVYSGCQQAMPIGAAKALFHSSPRSWGVFAAAIQSSGLMIQALAIIFARSASR